MTLAVIILVIAAIAVVRWRLSLHFYPYTSTCWFCRGRGKFPGSRTDKHGPCPRCKGKPRLRRFAREPR